MTTRRRGKQRFPVFLVLLCMAMVAPAFTVGPNPALDGAAPDRDLRKPLHRGGPAATEAAPGPQTPAQAKALDDLRAAAPGLTVRWSPVTGSPSRIHDVAGYLSEPQPGPPEQAARGFLIRQLALFNLSPGDVSELRAARGYRTEHNGMHHYTFRQQVHGIDVFRGEVQMNLSAEGRVIDLSGEPIPNVHALINVREPGLTSDEAIALAAATAGIENLRASKVKGLVYFPLGVEEVRLAWEVRVEDGDTPNAYRTVVDAVDGSILFRRNLTQYDHIPAHGPVFTSDSPNPDTPQGSSPGCCVSRQDRPFHGGEFFPHDDDHYDWWNGAARTTTISNNVQAQEDRDGDDSGGFRPTVGSDEDFTFTLDLTQDPSVEDGTTQNQSSAIVNLFYWNNRIHDIYYRLGFNEAAGNFQSDNFGHPGDDGDPVIADAQDNRDGDKLCNANFQTPDDGTSPRMQMYQCDNSTPERDGDLEDLVVIHEYTHGLSNRLIADLMESQGGGMGEGWSDFYGLAVTGEADDDLRLAYPRGQWFYNNVNGNRSSPYSTDQSIYPRTYADINDVASCAVKTCSEDPSTTCDDDDDCSGTCDTLSCSFQTDCETPNTTISQGPCRAGVHRTGEVWANSLWIARANLIWKYGFATGRQTILQLVTDGMKLTPADPDFLDARDKVLLADLVNFGGSNQCLLWDAFAKMGLGVSALSGGSADINVIEAFDTPSACTPNIQVNAPLDLGGACEGGFSTNQLEIFNTGSGDLVVKSVTKVSGSDDITVDVLPEPPFVIGSGSHVDFTVRCEPSSGGTKTTTFRITSSDSDQPTIDLVYTCEGLEPDLVTVIADDANFGDVCLDTFKDLDMQIHNAGGCPLKITDIDDNSTQWEVPLVMSYPLSVAPGGQATIPVRFEPTSLGMKMGSFNILSNDPDTPNKQVSFEGNVPPGEIRVTGSGDFGDVCAEELAEKTISVCNVGLCTLGVTSASIDCPDFTIINNPFPSDVSHDFCMDLVVRFTPTSAGPKQCTLTIQSDDPVTPTVMVELTGNTPLPMIDVPDDLAFAPEVLQSVGICESSLPFPVSNVGQCNLEITAFEISGNPAEYSLSGLPSFPIILEPGHIAGEGDLGVVFGPEIHDRDRLGEIRVEWVSEPILGTTSVETRDTCGESTLTGARVLVTHGGVVMDEVKSIKLHRIGPNRNLDQLDTIDNATNLTPQTVTPDAPCGAYMFHREYGGVSNPVQLAAGAYQVSVMVRIDGKNLKKIVGFDVTSCDFNPTVVVDF